jgi:citrate lyase beta subunit
VRVANPRAGRLRAELEAALSEDVAAVLLAETRLPQDLRDADVELRRQELQLGLTPGRFRLIPEVGSAAALARLAQLLAAVDRLASVGVDLEAVANDLGAPDATAAALQQPLLAQIAVTATAARVPWTVAATGFSAGDRAALASRARALGAAGVYVASEAEVAGLNALFAPPTSPTATR